MNIMRNIKWRISDLRGRDISWLFQIITLTITFVAVFYAVGYFTTQSSLEIRHMLPDLHEKDVWYYSDTIHTFYRRNSLPIPKALKGFFAVKKRTIPEDYIDITDSAPDIDIITAIRREQRIPQFILDRRIDMLKKQLDQYNYKKRIYGYSGRGGYPQPIMKKMLNDYEKLVSSQDFYFFLAAAIYTREVKNHIFIKNNGEIDIKNVEVQIPAPTSKITENRNDSILAFSFEGFMPHKIEQKGNVVFVSLPMLRIDKSFSVRLISRENRIDTNEIYYTYEGERLIDYKWLLIISAGAFFTIFGLRVFFKGQNSVHNRSS